MVPAIPATSVPVLRNAFDSVNIDQQDIRTPAGHARRGETTIVIRTPKGWNTMVVLFFALQLAAFSSRTLFIQLDT